MRIPERVNEKQDEDTDDEEMHLQELDKVAARARDLERILVPEQDRIIDQATQALNLCDVYRQKNTVFANKWDAEYVHTERLLLIAGKYNSPTSLYFEKKTSWMPYNYTIIFILQNFFLFSRFF